MSESAVVRCPACMQKYRMAAHYLGRRARCRKCGALFVIDTDQPIDDDTIMGWITDEDPSSESVMGGTGIFHGPVGNDEVNADQVSNRLVRLRKINKHGAYFEFPDYALGNEQLRNSMPRKCVGCCVREDLQVHLIHWSERLFSDGRTHWKDLTDTTIGRLDEYVPDLRTSILHKLPQTKHTSDVFCLPFPVFACPRCTVSEHLEPHVLTKRRRYVCQIRLTNLSVAVSFFRNNGGRESWAYRVLSEERDKTRDAWEQLDPPVRNRIAQWYEPSNGEHFLRFFRDDDFAVSECGMSGLCLTDQRIICKKYTFCQDYPLEEDGRLELIWHGDKAVVHIFERGHKPGSVKLNRLAVDELTAYLKQLNCAWPVVS